MKTQKVTNKEMNPLSMTVLRCITAISYSLSTTCCSLAPTNENALLSEVATANPLTTDYKDTKLTTQTLATDVIKCDDRDIEIFKSKGSQGTVVFINGFRMPLSNWSQVISHLQSNNSSITLVSYNRPGVGKSSKAEVPQTGDVVVDDMKAAIRCSGATEPVVLVAHSIGGLFANLYARKYPSTVEGLILVDAPHPEEILEQKAQGVPFMLNAINNGFKFVEKKFNPYKFSEDEEITTTIEQSRHGHPFPEIPLTVITGTKKMPFAPESAMEIHQKYQTKLLELSPKSTHILADGSGHFPQIDQPQLISDAILSLLKGLAQSR